MGGQQESDEAMRTLGIVGVTNAMKLAYRAPALMASVLLYGRRPFCLLEVKG